jgi:TRAP transporter TAXI family solute receptor
LLHTWGIDPASTAKLQAELAALLKDLHVELMQTSLSTTALEMLQHRDVDAVFTFATFAYMASTGQLTSIKFPDEIRAIAELPSRPVQVVVRAPSEVTSVAALRGRRVSIGPIGSNTNIVAQLLLSAFGISQQAFTAEHFTLHDASRRFIAGEIDAFFANGYAYPDVAEALRHGGRLLDIEGAEIDRSRTTYPLLHPTVLPRGTYPTIDRPVHTVGIDEIFLCRADLDETIVHELTRAFVEVVARRDLDIEALRYMDLGAASSTAIPLHSGAARYYRERELLP